MSRNPKRIRLSREKGSRLPEGAINVARPSKWGNPFKVGEQMSIGPIDFREIRIVQSNKMAVEAFRNMLERPRRRYPDLEEIISELHGKDLACWCGPGEPCHADVLLEIANGKPGNKR